MQQPLADRFHLCGRAVEARAGQLGQRVQCAVEIAGIVAVLQPERGHFQCGFVQFQRQALQHAQLRIGGLAGRDALHAVVFALAPAGGGNVPHRGFGQFVERGGFQRVVVVQHRLERAFRLFQFKQRIGFQRAPDFHFKLHPVQLQ